MAVDAVAFHNDVVAAANENVLFAHQQALDDRAGVYAELRRLVPEVEIVEVPASAVSLEDAIQLPAEKRARFREISLCHAPQVAGLQTHSAVSRLKRMGHEGELGKMHTTADIVIIGAGIIGMSAAYQIARRAKLRIVVLEKGGGPGEGSTGASSAVCRFRYSHPETVALAQAGIDAYRRWPDFLGTSEPFARFHEIGVLWMSKERDWSRDEGARLGALGVRTELLDDAAVAARYPSINPCVVAPDLIGGTAHDCVGDGLHLLETEGGYMDPVDALQDLIQAARREGVEVRFRAPAAELEVQGGAVTGVRIATGERIACGAAIMAAGAWCTEFLEREGLGRWPLEPTRIQIAHIDRPATVGGELPVCVDMPGGIYFRPQNRGQQLIIGSVLEEDEREAAADPDHFASFVDDDFVHAKLHALQHRLRLDDIRGPVRGYSGLYTINRADMHPVVGRTPVGGLLVANGCSGHGFKLAPAIGSLLAQAVTGRRRDFDTDVDPNFLSFDRKAIPMATMSVLA